MPVIVEAPDHEPMLVDQAALALEHWIVLEPIGLVGVIVEGWLVRNDQVRASGGRALDHIAAGKKCRDDALEWLGWIAYFHCIDGIVRGVIGCRREGHVDHR